MKPGVKFLDLFVVFDYGSTWMEDINHFFVMVCKDSLKDIRLNIIEEMDGKKNPHPSRLRGRGVEVSKTLCSQNRKLFSL